MSLPAANLLFRRFELDVGTSGGAREMFQTFVTDLIRVRHPTATEVGAAGGQDWGIDTYVGNLEGTILAWQSKFFLEWRGESQRGQVRDSFNELMEKAAESRIKVESWTLAVATILPPDEQRWLDNWMVRNKRKYGVRMSALNASDLRGLLIKPDYQYLRHEYFSDSPGRPPAAPPLHQASDLSLLSEALFVRQLEEAGLVETDNARGAFFAAEALVRSLVEQQNVDVVHALEEITDDLHHIWESSFNARAPQADLQGRIDGLLDSVMEAAGQASAPAPLTLRSAHKRGMVHRLVEDARAGWILRWREIALTHSGRRAADLIEAQLATGSAVTASTA